MHRFFVGFSTIFVALTALVLFVLYPVRAAYYGIVDGNYLLNVESVQAEKTVEQDDQLSVAFCRSPRTRIVAVNNIRTFYLTEDNKPVFQRQLPDGVSYERTSTKCLPLSIHVDQRPNDLGKYRFCQEFDFFTEFNQKKSVSFCSTEYEVVPPVREPVPAETLNLDK